MSLRIRDLKRNDRIKDAEDTYRVMADPELIDGIWQIETVTGGDYDYVLNGNHPLALEVDEWIKRPKRVAFI